MPAEGITISGTMDRGGIIQHISAGLNGADLSARYGTLNG